MTEDLLARPLVPVASPGDAEVTCEAVLPRVAAAGGHLTALHVAETTEGAPDVTGVEQSESYAEEVFAVVRERAAAAGVAFETRLVFEPDVVAAILDVAAESDATAIVFTPRGGSRWLDLLTGDTSRDLVKRADRPVLVLPAEEP